MVMLDAIDFDDNSIAINFKSTNFECNFLCIIYQIYGKASLGNSHVEERFKYWRYLPWSENLMLGKIHSIRT